MSLQVVKITPKLGLGDLIFWKMCEINSVSKITKININPNIIQIHRLNSDNYLKFLKDFINKVFRDVIIELTESIHITPCPINFIKKGYIYDHCTFTKNPSYYSDYIVIHTKARFDYDSNNFYSKYLEQIKNFFGKSQFKYKIMLLGEKDNVEQNLETITHNIQSLYSVLLESLANHNEIIDLTRDGLYSDNTIESFEDDISKINNAKLNIVFGFGGPLTLSVAFSENTIGFIGNLNHDVLKKYSEFSEISLHSDTKTFIENISQYTVNS